MAALFSTRKRNDDALGSIPPQFVFIRVHPCLPFPSKPFNAGDARNLKFSLRYSALLCASALNPQTRPDEPVLTISTLLKVV
jgi:hypothetical protein